MIRLETPVKTFIDLEHFYNALVERQKEAHGDEYIAHHNIIRDKAKDCKSYRELGVMQGATAAAAALAGYEYLELIDTHPKPFMEYESLFKKYNYKLIVDSSTNLIIEDRPFVDFLLIDSNHKPAHLRKELEIHPQKVNKYILFHDTFAVKTLQDVIDEFVKKNYTDWALVEYYQENVGYTLIKRIGNAR